MLAASCLAVALSALSVSPLAAESARQPKDRAKSEESDTVKIAVDPGPRTVLISLKKQRLRLLDGDREIATSRISSGQPGFDTPTGVFSILEKSVYHESNIYAGAPMPFMQRITWSGVAMHAGVVPGYRASHGCVRLPYSFAKTFYDKTNVGARVIISNDEIRPVPFEHDALFKPLPADDPVPTQGASASPRLAANDQGPEGNGALNTLMSVTPALAGESANPIAETGKPRSRAEAARMAAAKLQRLKDELKAAEALKTETSERAKLALRAADDADTKLKAVRGPYEGVLKAVTSAQAARAAASEAYTKYLRTAVAPADEKQRQQLEDKEFELEDRLLDLTVEADAARANAAEAELVIADAKAAFAIADANKTKTAEDVRNAITALRTAQTALIDAQKAQQRRGRQLSIFISLKSQRIYIRQGFEPIYDGKIEVDDPPGAVGTHVFTAMEYNAGGNGYTWQLISAQPPRLAAGQDRGDGKKSKSQPGGISVGVSSPMNVEAARVALDAIRVPEEIKDMITELGKPGMSLIISERDLSAETGKGTEFVVLTR